MKKFDVKVKKSVNAAEFGCSREKTREVFGKKFQEIRKNKFSLNTMDAYESFHVFFTEDNKFEAIEIFGDIKVAVNGEKIFPGGVDKAIKALPELKKDDYGLIDRINSIGITLSQDDENKIEAILFGCEGYYKG